MTGPITVSSWQQVQSYALLRGVVLTDEQAIALVAEIRRRQADFLAAVDQIVETLQATVGSAAEVSAAILRFGETVATLDPEKSR